MNIQQIQLLLFGILSMKYFVDTIAYIGIGKASIDYNSQQMFKSILCFMIFVVAYAYVFIGN